MANLSVIDVDLANVYEQPNRRGFLHAMAWGDVVEVLETTSEHLRIKTVKYETRSDGSILFQPVEAYICPSKSSKVKPENVVVPVEDSRVLKINFVDVQQGDGIVIESPDGKVILVDGGDNQLFARYLATRWRDTSAAHPKKIDCMVVTHGDADHFVGLMEIYESQTNHEPRKRIFIEPQRIYHNGLVKRPSEDAHGEDIKEDEQFGPTKVVDGDTIITGLEENLLDVPSDQMNEKFRQWKDVLGKWNQQHKIEFRRLSYGQDDAFDFFKGDDLEISVLGPILTQKGNISGLKFLSKPPGGIRTDEEAEKLDTTNFKGISASHTINGHSIVFKLRYGSFSFLFTGDLNDEAGRILAQLHQQGKVNLRSEVFKVPHHGSSDYSGALLGMVSPLVSVISCGDESTRKEYIHPRATLMGALGRHSRGTQPLIFVTELVAFFSSEGWSHLTNPEKAEKRGDFYGFSRAAFGIVKTRTDGKRLLVYTDSGKTDQKEAYCYTLDANGQIKAEEVKRV